MTQPPSKRPIVSQIVPTIGRPSGAAALDPKVPNQVLDPFRYEVIGSDDASGAMLGGPDRSCRVDRRELAAGIKQQREHIGEDDDRTRTRIVAAIYGSPGCGVRVMVTRT